MTVRELHALLGELLSEHGDEEVAYNNPHSMRLWKVTGVSHYETTGDIHGWPSFARIEEKFWASGEWHRATP